MLRRMAPDAETRGLPENMVEPVSSVEEVASDEAAGAWLDRLDPGSLTPRRIEEVRKKLAALGAKPSRAAADALLRAIDRSALRSVRTSDGTSLRAHATEALLTMGFPYALEVPPDALEQARDERKSRSSGHTLRKLAWGCVAADAALCVSTLVAGGWSALSFGAFAFIACIVAAVTGPSLLACREDGFTAWLGGLAFFGVAAAQLALGAHWGALGSVLSAVLFLTARHLEKSASETPPTPAEPLFEAGTEAR